MERGINSREEDELSVSKSLLCTRKRRAQRSAEREEEEEAAAASRVNTDTAAVNITSQLLVSSFNPLVMNYNEVTR